MVLSQEVLDTFSSCSYNPSNRRINLENNVKRVRYKYIKKIYEKRGL